MKNDYFRYYKPKSLIPLLVLLGILLYLGNSFVSTHWSLSFPIIGIISGLLVWINFKLWKVKPFSYLFWSIDLSGSYEGEIHYTNPATKEEQSKPAFINIYQTGSSIKLISRFDTGENREESLSKSLQTSLVKDEHGNYEIVFTYRNEGNQKLGFSPHYGTNIFRVIGDKTEGRVLKGTYYTDRKPHQTSGTIHVKFKSKKQQKT